MHKCSVCGKLSKKKYTYNKQILCERHYVQCKKYGAPQDKNPRTCNDLNEFYIENNIAHFYLYNQRCDKIGEFLVDADDVELIRYKKWCYSRSTGYVLTGNNIGKNKRVPLHRYLLFGYTKSDKTVDHINHNKLDNRRCNLRVCTQTQNCQNKGLQTGNERGNKFGIAGVYFNKKRCYYEVEIRYNNHRLHLSRYYKLEEAIYVRYLAELRLYGEFRNTVSDKVVNKSISKLNTEQMFKLKGYVDSRVKVILQQ